MRIVPVHPAPTAQPRVQNIHSNPKTNALEKRAGYRRLFEKNIKLTIQTDAGTESFLARNGAGSEPVPAIPLQPLQANHVLYLNDDARHQPLCNKLKRLGITCVFVAAKVSV